MNALLVILLVTPMLGCVTASNETQFKEVKPKQRVYVGKVDVTLNSQRAEKCELFMNSKLSPNLKLSKDGYVVYRTSDRKPYIGKVRCLHRINNRKSAWHTQNLELSPLVRPKKRKSVNYFGHLKVDWDIDPDKTLSAPATDPYAFQQVGMVSDSGEIKIQIQDNTEEASNYIKTHWEALKDFRVETHLAVSETAGEDEE